MGHGTPLDAVFQNVQDSVDDFSARHLGRATPGLGSGDQGLKDGPFLIAEVAGVGWACPLRPSRIQDFYDSLSLMSL